MDKVSGAPSPAKAAQLRSRLRVRLSQVPDITVVDIDEEDSECAVAQQASEKTAEKEQPPQGASSICAALCWCQVLAAKKTRPRRLRWSGTGRRSERITGRQH